jgi:hypothetical protein
MLLMLSRSWLGKEDHELEQRLHVELPGILNWALAGLERLTIDNDNRFTRLASAEEAITTMRDLASPVAAFVREKCEINANNDIEVDLLYSATRLGVRTTSTQRPASRCSGAIYAPPSPQPARRGQGMERNGTKLRRHRSPVTYSARSL